MTATATSANIPKLMKVERRNLEDRVKRLELARRIAAKHDVDAGDVEHVLFNMTLSPIEKLRGAMSRARLRGLANNGG